jgi:deferrochelatase/peroxidase EfeB
LSGRRSFIASAGVFVASAGSSPLKRARAKPFFGEHQTGITTPQQTQTYFAALDVIAKRTAEVASMLRAWTDAAGNLMRGDELNNDSGEAAGLGAADLTLTFGIGASLFDKRYGLAARRPAALVDLPVFNGDQLVAERSGGDLSIQACANDPQVAFHAVRQLVRLGDGVARVRWTQTGFLPASVPGETPRNLLGFKDGTRNAKDPVTSATRVLHGCKAAATSLCARSAWR